MRRVGLRCRVGPILTRCGCGRRVRPLRPHDGRSCPRLDCRADRRGDGFHVRDSRRILYHGSRERYSVAMHRNSQVVTRGIMSLRQFVLWLPVILVVLVLSPILRRSCDLFSDPVCRCWICNRMVYSWQHYSWLPRGPVELYHVDGMIRSAIVSGTGLVHDRCRCKIVVRDLPESKMESNTD